MKRQLPQLSKALARSHTNIPSRFYTDRVLLEGTQTDTKKVRQEQAEFRERLGGTLPTYLY